MAFDKDLPDELQEFVALRREDFEKRRGGIEADSRHRPGSPA